MNFDVNYLAILVSAIGFMIVSYLWYGPFFNKPWTKAVGMTPESMRAASKGMMGRSMVIVFICALVSSFVLAVLLKSLLITTVNIGSAIELAVVVWLGFVATTMLHRVVFEKSSFNLWLINASQSLVAFIVGVLILTLWPW